MPVEIVGGRSKRCDAVDVANALTPRCLLCPTKASRVWQHPTRVSINVFAGTGMYTKAIFGEMLRHSQAQEKFPLEDEPLLSYTLPAARGDPTHAVMSCTVVHYHFGGQQQPFRGVRSTQMLALLEAWQRLGSWTSTSGLASWALTDQVLWFPHREMIEGGEHRGKILWKLPRDPRATSRCTKFYCWSFGAAGTEREAMG